MGYEIDGYRAFGEVFGTDQVGVKARNMLARAGYRSVDEVRRTSDVELFLRVRMFGRVMLKRVRDTIGYEEPSPASLVENGAPPAWTVIC